MKNQENRHQENKGKTINSWRHRKQLRYKNPRQNKTQTHYVKQLRHTSQKNNEHTGQPENTDNHWTTVTYGRHRQLRNQGRHGQHRHPVTQGQPRNQGRHGQNRQPNKQVQHKTRNHYATDGQSWQSKKSGKPGEIKHNTRKHNVTDGRRWQSKQQLIQNPQ